MWMDPFFRVCLDAPRLCLTESNEQVQSKHGMGHLCPNLVADDSHIIQIHTTTMEMFVSQSISIIAICRFKIEWKLTSCSCFFPTGFGDVIQRENATRSITGYT